MKKRTAILLFGTLLCAIAGYVAWCFRPFYLKPRLEFSGDVSPGARTAAKSWAKTDSYPRLREFEWELARECLRYPWEDWRESSVVIEEEAGAGLWARGIYPVWVFSKSGGKWSLPAPVQLRGFGDAGVTDDMRHQGTIATRLEAAGTGEGTLEIAILGRYSEVDPESPDAFHYAMITRRVPVPAGPARQQLVEGIARSIREITWDTLGGYFDPAGPGYGIIFTRGDRKFELAIWPDDRISLAFGDDADTKYDRDSTKGQTTFLITPAARSVLDAFLDQHGVPRSEPAREVE